MVLDLAGGVYRSIGSSSSDRPEQRPDALRIGAAAAIAVGWLRACVRPGEPIVDAHDAADDAHAEGTEDATLKPVAGGPGRG